MSERRNGRSNTELVAAGLKECPECKFCWSTAGFNRHYKPCKLRSENRQRAAMRSQTAKTESPSVSRDSYTRFRRDHLDDVFGKDVPRLLSLATSSNSRSSPNMARQGSYNLEPDSSQSSNINGVEPENDLHRQELSE